jgi:C4-dicarboxylate-specific signal transduction histidine kinase/ligand-binding sensor domain-containing protein
MMLVLGGAWVCGASGAAPEGFPVAQILDHRSGFTGSFPSSVVVDREGRIWVSSDLAGLFVGDGLRFLKVELPQALAGRSVSAVAADLSGRIWVLSAGGLGTWERGIWQVDPEIRQHYPLNPLRTDGIFSHPSGALVVLASGRAYRIPPGGRPQAKALPGEDDDGEIGLAWAGDRLVANRLGRFWREEGDGWTPLPTILLSVTERLSGPLRADGAGHLYLLTNLRLHHLAPGAGMWDTLPNVRPTEVDRMTSLQDGRVWILQNGQALCGFQGEITRHLMPPNMTTHGATALCLDAERNLWISSTVLVRLPAAGAVRQHAGPGYPPAQAVWQILRDRAGALWVAVETGLFRRDDSGWRSVPGVPKAHVMEVGPDGRLYVGDRNRLVRVEMRTLKAESVPIPILPDGVAVSRGPVIRGDKLWVCDAFGRLIQGIWRESRWTWSWDSLPNPEGNKIVDLMMDDIGRPWAIRSDRVFCRFEESWEELPKFSGTGGGGPMGFSFRSKEEGLAAQYDPPAVVVVRRASSGWATHTLLGPDELRDIGVLYSIRQDPKGTIWLGTDRGVVRVEPGDPPRLRRFGTDMGLPSEDTNQGALLVEGMDRVWVGTSEGLAEIRAGELVPLPPMAAPSILEVRCGSRASQGPDSVTNIQYGQGLVAWELGFPGPVRGYRAGLEFRTLGGTWTVLSGTALQFPSLSPGRHLYEVRVVPSLGAAGASRRLEINVHPPWYRHTLAYLIYGLIAAGLLAVGFRGRIALLERRNRELNMAVDGATKELRQHRENLEKLIKERTADLNQRVRELQCLYGVSRLIAESGNTVEEVFEKAVHLLPSGWNHPEIACARIVFEGGEFTTENFRETPWRLSADVAALGKKSGSVEVFYLEERPSQVEGPFFKEERALIDDLGLQLGVMVENRLAEEEKRNLHEQLFRAEKLAAVGELIAGVAHEINNPLTGIVGLSELLLRENKENLDEDTKKDLKSIFESSERIKKIVANLLRFARRGAPMRKDVSINELLDRVISIRDYEMNVRNVELKKNYQLDLPLVMADPSQLEQVFLNLITNAEYAIHDHQQKAGTLTIATSVVPDNSGGETVVIEFSDTGTGIPIDVLPKLFNPFFTTKGVGKGTGLGLSTSYGIIKGHGGEIYGGNRAEGGAVFTVKLPVQRRC